MFHKIAIIGTGNVGVWLLKTLQYKNNIPVTAFSSRNIKIVPPDFDLYIFALKDEIYNDVLQDIPFKLPNAVHTSGSLSQTILSPFSKNNGVLYPYQSITNYTLKIAEHINYKDDIKMIVPVCVEGSDMEFENALFHWASSVFEMVHRVSEKQRFAMHLAAIFANNFTNAMYSIAYQIFKENNIEWSLIFPLLENSLNKTKLGDPRLSQTGPAVRNDSIIMEKHCIAIENKKYRELYLLISEIIQYQNVLCRGMGETFE